MQKKSIIIDGNSLIYRMFFGIKEMSNAKGIPTNAIYGFVGVLWKIQQEYKPDYLGVAFDLKAPTFRHTAYEAYKDGRDKMPEDLVVQLELLKKLLGIMQVAVLELEGYEADDIIGTLAKQGKQVGAKTQIITGDRDSFQLVDDDINILYTTTRSGSNFMVINKEAIQEQYGVSPEELIEVKALMGDKSDNIPGIAGIGEKTALKLIKQYHNLETLYENTADLKGKQKEKIELGKEDAFTSRFLGTICLDVPLEKGVEALAVQPMFNEEAVTMLKELGFKSIIAKLGNESTPQGKALGDVSYMKINKASDLGIVLENLVKTAQLVIHGIQNENGIWLVIGTGNQYYYLSGKELVTAFFSEFMALPNADNILTIGHDLKQMTHLYEKFGAVITNYEFDTLIAAYLLNPADLRYEISELSLKYLEITLESKEEFFGKGKKFTPPESIDDEKLGGYLVSQCRMIHQLKKMMEEKLIEYDMKNLFKDIELPLLQTMAAMETQGFKIDIEALEALSKNFEKRLVVLTNEIYDLAGYEFNINSTKQLGKVLFEDLQLPVIKKTKTGFSTSVEVLEELQPYHEIIDKILEYRSLAKLDSTYGIGLINLVDTQTQKVYTTFNQTVTATGRLSSSEPNLQNIPVRTELGREIRKVFIASTTNHILVGADYSQIELRVLAHLSGDEGLVHAFMENQDIHARTASEIFGIPMDMVTREQRSQAKAINFGLIYGKQAFSLAKELGINRKNAQDYIDMYFKRYPKVLEYMENIKKEAHETGYVTTLWGRRRYIPEISSRNKMIAQSGERMALNTPIQGTAADIIKRAMIAVEGRLRKEGLQTQLILQVHDELILDAPEAEAEKVQKLLIEEMEGAVQLMVPLTVDSHLGKTWFDLK